MKSAFAILALIAALLLWVSLARPAAWPPYKASPLHPATVLTQKIVPAPAVVPTPPASQYQGITINWSAVYQIQESTNQVDWQPVTNVPVPAVTAYIVRASDTNLHYLRGKIVALPEPMVTTNTF